jgi:hypothetical protein
MKIKRKDYYFKLIWGEVRCAGLVHVKHIALPLNNVPSLPRLIFKRPLRRVLRDDGKEKIRARNSFRKTVKLYLSPKG